VGNSSDMIFSIDQIICYVSQFITLKIGDIIFTGTPKGVGKVAINDRLEGFIENEKMLNFRIK
jgi:acylpyruvate hydrolase